jgi:hypothetical protein
MSQPASGDANDATGRCERGQPVDQAGRRRSERFAYHSELGVCRYDGDGPPPLSEFRRAQARNISTSGVAFYWPEEPPSGPLVLALGDAENPIFVLANVVWCEEGWFDHKRQYLVGCLMTGRLDRTGRG